MNMYRLTSTYLARPQFSSLEICSGVKTHTYDEDKVPKITLTASSENPDDAIYLDGKFIAACDDVAQLTQNLRTSEHYSYPDDAIPEVRTTIRSVIDAIKADPIHTTYPFDVNQRFNDVKTLLLRLITYGKCKVEGDSRSPHLKKISFEA